MSYNIGKSVNMRDINNIKVIYSCNNIRPLHFSEGYYTDLAKFIMDLDGGLLQLYDTSSNVKYMYALLKTREELKKYSELQYGFYSLDEDGEEFKEIVEVYKKYLNEKDSKKEYVIKFSKDIEGYYVSKTTTGFKYGPIFKAKKLSKKEAEVISSKINKYEHIIEQIAI